MVIAWAKGRIGWASQGEDKQAATLQSLTALPTCADARTHQILRKHGNILRAVVRIDSHQPSESRGTYNRKCYSSVSCAVRVIGHSSQVTR